MPYPSYFNINGKRLKKRKEKDRNNKKRAILNNHINPQIKMVARVHKGKKFDFRVRSSFH